MQCNHLSTSSLNKKQIVDYLFLVLTIDNLIYSKLLSGRRIDAKLLSAIWEDQSSLKVRRVQTLRIWTQLIKLFQTQSRYVNRV
jgi:hypothetical protein